MQGETPGFAARVIVEVVVLTVLVASDARGGWLW